MKAIQLPAQLNPISRRKDKSLKLSFETSEMGTEAIVTLMALEGLEGWLSFAPNQTDLPEAPVENAEVEGKTPAQRMRAVLFILFKQAVAKGKYVGTFDGYYGEQVEKILNALKDKIEE